MSNITMKSHVKAHERTLFKQKDVIFLFEVGHTLIQSIIRNKP